MYNNEPSIFYKWTIKLEKLKNNEYNASKYK